MNTYFFNIRHQKSLTEIYIESGTFSCNVEGVNAYNAFLGHGLKKMQENSGCKKEEIEILAFNKI